MRFVSITKPGIIFGNIITLTGGFFLAYTGQVSLLLYFITALGMSLVIASGCVFNNCIDCDIDQLMERTKQRVLPQGLISKPVAMLYGVGLGLLGFALLYFEVNTLTTLVALLGLVVYVMVYSLWFKRHSVLGTAIGGVAGAIPPVVGYVAVTNQLDLAALSLFLILFFWQIPHSYAIAIFRFKDYQTASIPVLPVKSNIRATKISMLVCVLAFIAAVLLPTVWGYKSWIYGAAALLMGLAWLTLSVRGFTVEDDVRWARKMFLYSILIITALSVLLAV